ncbi:MAG: NUDIX hydrolase [Opitutales bacterium]|nr:NUDIX hydrolase [Opitutales bacterium]
MEDKSRTPAHWEQLSEEEVADCKVFKVLRRKMRNPSNGKEGDFSVIKAFNWVVAIAETVDHNYVIVNQFRFGSKALSWEFPAGCIDENEDPISAAERELREESGYLPQAPGRIIGKARPNPALQDNDCWFVLFEQVSDSGKTEWDEHEQLECKELPLKDILSMTRSGEMSHAMAHAALFFLLQHKTKP